MVGDIAEEVGQHPLDWLLDFAATENFDTLFNAQIYTSYSEGMSNTLLESLSCGVPAICCNIDGYNSIVDEKCGFIVERLSKEYVEKIVLLKNNPNLHKKISTLTCAIGR